MRKTILFALILALACNTAVFADVNEYKEFHLTTEKHEQTAYVPYSEGELLGYTDHNAYAEHEGIMYSVALRDLNDAEKMLSARISTQEGVWKTYGFTEIQKEEPIVEEGYAYASIRGTDIDGRKKIKCIGTTKNGAVFDIICDEEEFDQEAISEFFEKNGIDKIE